MTGPNSIKYFESCEEASFSDPIARSTSSVRDCSFEEGTFLLRMYQLPSPFPVCSYPTFSMCKLQARKHPSSKLCLLTRALFGTEKCSEKLQSKIITQYAAGERVALRAFLEKSHQSSQSTISRTAAGITKYRLHWQNFLIPWSYCWYPS